MGLDTKIGKGVNVVKGLAVDLSGMFALDPFAG